MIKFSMWPWKLLTMRGAFCDEVASLSTRGVVGGTCGSAAFAKRVEEAAGG